MTEETGRKSAAELAAEIVRDAGGKVVGRTRLQKMAYILEIAGLGVGFFFQYRHYGPYSDELANAITEAQFGNLVTEDEHSTSWGGSYSIFSASPSVRSSNLNASRKRVLSIAVKADPVCLELAATAAFLAIQGFNAPWDETRRRKPEKSEKWLDSAKALYERLRAVNTPKPLPLI